MIGVKLDFAKPTRQRRNDGLSTNQGTRGSMYLQITEEAPLRCSARLADGQLVSHQYNSTYEVDSELVAARRRLLTLYALRRDQRRALRAAHRYEKHRLLAEFRESCWYEVPRFYYRKVVEFRTRPVYALRGIYVPYRVTRRKLLRKIPYKRKVVWYTTIVLQRHRGLVRKKRRHEKVITLYKRIWRIWTEVHRRKFGKEKYLVRIKTYKVARRVKTPLSPKRVFDVEKFKQYLSRWLQYDLQSSPLVQSWMQQINGTNRQIADLRLYAERLPHSDNRCRFVNATTLLESTSKTLISQHRFNATFGRVAMPVCVGPYDVAMPRVEKYSRVAGHSEFYAIEAVDLDSGQVLASGKPGAEDQPTSFFYRGFGTDPIRSRVNQDALDSLYPHDGDMPTYDINDPLIYAKTHGSMWSAAQALLNGRVNGPEDPFVLTRSVGELKDSEQTIATFREALTWASAQDTSSTSYKRLTALEAKWRSGVRLSAKDAMQFKRLSPGLKGIPRGTLVYAAALYCCYRFAIEPTLDDILTVAEDWKKAVFGLRNNLAKMLGALDDPQVSQVTLKKYYRPDLRPQGVSTPSLPPRQDKELEFSFEGPDTTGDNTDTYDLYLGESLIRSVVRNVVTYSADGSEFFDELRSKGRIVTFYHERRSGLVYYRFDRDTLAALIGEDIRHWRDAVAQTLERAKFLETIWELIPLSFILNWFATTGQAISNLHNLVMTWYSGTYEFSYRLWATQRVDRIFTTTLTSAMSVDASEPELSHPVELRTYRSKEAYERGSYSVWRTLYRNCKCKISAHEYFPAVLKTQNEFKVRTFYRGPYDASSDTLGAITALVPIPKIQINLGKLVSLTAVLTGILLGRNGRKSAPR